MGKHCFGKTPMQTFNDSRWLVLEKQVDSAFNENDATPGNSFVQMTPSPSVRTDSLLSQGVAVERSETEIPLTQQAVLYTKSVGQAARAGEGMSQSIGQLGQA